jgi:Ca2+-binding EF-hand superfamily protein
MFMEEFDTNNDGKVSLEEFKATLLKMRAKLDTKKDIGKEYTSFN